MTVHVTVHGPSVTVQGLCSVTVHGPRGSSVAELVINRPKRRVLSVPARLVRSGIRVVVGGRRARMSSN